VGDLVDHTEGQLKQRKILTLADLRACPHQLIAVSPSSRQAKEDLEAWLFANLYRDPRVNRVFHKAQRVLNDLFRFFTTHPDSLPLEHAARAEGAGLYRAVADYIAGMTDRFAIDEHRSLFAP
jgi:dGTPase